MLCTKFLHNPEPSNAIFLVDRLLAERDDEENQFLLAKCCLALNKHYTFLKDCTSEIYNYKYRSAESKNLN
jgi:hypothetical protein